jgi:hypothetical protein
VDHLAQKGSAALDLIAKQWIGPTFGYYDPMAVQAEDLMALRAKVAERVSESEAHRVIKVWRALWKKLKPLKYPVDPHADPSRSARRARGLLRCSRRSTSANSASASS